jgi:hypothetical protein
VTDVVLVLLVAALAAVIGLGFGIVVLAPRIGRLLDRAEADEATAPDRSDEAEEPRDRPA